MSVHFDTYPRAVCFFRDVIFSLVVQDYAQEGIIDVDLAVVDLAVIVDEAQFLEFIHEEIDSGARCPNHFRQSLLGYSGNHLLRQVLLAIPS